MPLIWVISLYTGILTPYETLGLNLAAPNLKVN